MLQTNKMSCQVYKELATGLVIVEARINAKQYLLQLFDKNVLVKTWCDELSLSKYPKLYKVISGGRRV